MFIVQHPLVVRHYAPCFAVGLAVAQALAREHPTILGCPRAWTAPDTEHMRPVRVVGLSELFELKPERTPSGRTRAKLRHRYSLDFSGAAVTPDMVAVRFHCGTTGIELLAHQHLSALVALDRALDDLCYETVRLELNDGEKSGFTCPVEVGYVRIDTLTNVLCLTVEQASTLREDIRLSRPVMIEKEKAYLSKLQPTRKADA